MLERTLLLYSDPVSDRVEPRRVLQAVSRRWRLLLTVTILATVGGTLASGLLPEVYRAETSILVGQPLQAANLEQVDVEASQELARTYADIIHRRPVLAGVVERLGLDTNWRALQGDVRAEVSDDNAQLIQVTVHAASPGLAAAIASVVPSELTELVPASTEPGGSEGSEEFLTGFLQHVEEEIARGETAIGELRQGIDEAPDAATIDRLRRQLESEQRLLISWQQTYRSLSAHLSGAGLPSNLQVLEPAYAERKPVSPNVPLNVAGSAVLGLSLAFAISYVREYRRERLAKGRERPSEWPRTREPEELEDERRPLSVPDGRRTARSPKAARSRAYPRPRDRV